MAVVAHLKSLQALELALRRGSLKEAARELAITPAAVGQRVKALEDYLGIPLLVRGRAGLRAPPELEPAMAHLAAAFAELGLASAQLDLHRGHEIHIAAVPDFADLWLAPRLRMFRREMPHVRFCINGEGDVPLRLGPADSEIDFAATAERDRVDILFRDYLLPVGSPATAKRVGRQRANIRLEGYPLLHLDFYRNDPSALSWPDFFARFRMRRTAPERGLRFQRITRVLDAVAADAGPTIAGLALLQEPLQDERLVPLFPMRQGEWTRHAFQARYRPEALARPAVRRFRQWLATEAQRTAERLEQLVRTAARR